MPIIKSEDCIEYQNELGQAHREDGPAIEWANGTKYWFINGLQHRESEPAVEYATGDKFWYIKGKLHREDGPAIEYIDGKKSWYFRDHRINCQSQEEFEHFLKLKAFWDR